ncbi:hypothetical protein JOM56_009087 [Amanita muscaria]
MDTKELRRIFPQALTTVVPYGHARMVDGNEPIHGCQLVKLAPDHRDMSFVRVGFCPTIGKANSHNLPPPDLEMRDFFGRVLQFFTLDIPALPDGLIEQTTMIFAVIRQLKVTHQVKDPFRLCYFKDDSGPVEIVDINQIQCLVGRIYDRDEWAIVDRNKSSVMVYI